MNESRTAALLLLFDEMTALFHRLRAITVEVHGQTQVSAGQRGVLLSLHRLGPQTVPQLARARPVSRQHIQVLVNGLIEHGLVEIEDNPAHRRSPFVRLTGKGRGRVDAMRQRERNLLSHARLGLTKRQIEGAADALSAVRRFFEGKEWRRYVAGNDHD